MDNTGSLTNEISDVQRKHMVEDARYGFKNHNPSRRVNVGESERWLSAVGGIGMAVYGLKTRGFMGLTLGAMGASLIYRGLTGHCSGYSMMGISTSEEEHPRASLDTGIKVEHSIFIAADQVTLFQYWRNLSNLPNVMRHIKSVTERDTKRSTWVAKGPMNMDVEWDAEIINERENELIAWRSLPGSTVQNAGSVRFTRDGGGAGTVVKISMLYHPPAGRLGKAISTIMGENPKKQIEEDLQRFKELAEEGALNGAAIGG